MNLAASSLCGCTIFPVSSAAFAEVCDKEVPTWNLTDGPVSQLEYFAAAATSAYAVSIVALLVLALVFRRLWLQIFGGLVTLFVTLGMVSVLSDPIYVASIEEGCRASPYSVLFALTAALLAFGLLAAKGWRGRAAS
ncbi:MAG: hypothetical protein AAFU80_04100 [Pseudomonadota bacterium]